MAYTTIDNPSEYFEIATWTGNGSTQNITGLNFQPDMTWIKERNSTSGHVWIDALRGVDKVIRCNSTAVESTDDDCITAFNSDGFSLGDDVKTNEDSTKTYVSWSWKLNGTGSSDTNGTINTTATSANTTSGVSAVSYTGNASSSQTVGHGLGAVPEMIISKNRDNSSSNYNDFVVYHHSLASANDKKMKLNTTDASSTTNEWGDTDPTSTVYSVHSSGDGATNDGTDKIISYCFRSIKGFSKIGKYQANDTDTTSAGGGAPFIYTGFRPAFIMIKRAGGAQSWCVYDDRRGGNDENPYVEFDVAGAEQTNAEINICSNGFKLDDSGGEINYSTQEYLYWAVARHPFVSSKGVPTTAGTGNIVDGG